MYLNNYRVFTLYHHLELPQNECDCHPSKAEMAKMLDEKVLTYSLKLCIL